jgi:predicted nuclease with TOPRIM domain
MNISNALFSKYKGCEWTINNEDYSSLVWFSEDVPKPTEEELIEECERLQAEYEAKEYQRQRLKEYPSFAEQFDLLYHGGYDAWKAEIDKVKEKYPKPE